MQDRHERDRAESVMLGPAFQTPWVMEKLHDKKSRILPDSDILAMHMMTSGTILVREIPHTKLEEATKGFLSTIAVLR